MPYDLQFTTQAESAIQALPAHLLNIVEQELNRLASDPSQGRKVVSPPYPPGGQMFPFEHRDTDRKKHYFNAFFHFAPGETAIVITALTHQTPFFPTEPLP